jgi:CO/xanthine dehydrogenase FAD-binding subunit
LGSYLRPTSLHDALTALAAKPRTILAGGTDHFPARATACPDEDILDISALSEPRAIERRGAFWWVPSGATWTDAIEAGLPALFDGLVAAARQVGGVQIQNAGTLVGNVCNASPAADGIPALLALDAEVELASLRGTRALKLEAFLLGPRATARREDEIVTGLRIPHLAGHVRSLFHKLGGRRYLVISIAMLATVARLDADGAIAEIRMAIGACGATARRLRDLEAALLGRRPDPALVQPAHFAVLSPIDDIRGTASYRMAAAEELARRAVAALAPAEAQAA